MGKGKPKGRQVPTNWREGYEHAMREFVLAKGQPMLMDTEAHRWGGEPQPSYYGWTDFDALDHFEAAEPCVAFALEGAQVVEKHYQQFQGTDYSGETAESFIVLHPVRCACGQYKELYWAFQGSLSEAILGVINGPE